MTTEISIKQVDPLHVLTARRRLADQVDVADACVFAVRIPPGFL